MKKEIRKLRESFENALRGLMLCIRAERNFRVHMVTAFYVAIFAVLGGARAAEGAVLCVCFGLTMGAELMNTAVERLCDRQASGYDGLVRNAKDIAAAAVFVCAMSCVLVGLILFLGKGLLWSALLYLGQRLWIAVGIVVSMPAALLFIFRFGRTI